MGNDELKASREKYWEELSDSEKIERMRRIIKRTIAENARLMRQVRELGEHQHGKFGEILVKPKHSGFGYEEDSVESNKYF